MKGATLKRANLSREKIAMLEAFENYRSNRYYDTSANKSKQDELDFLWQNLKVAATSEKSPVAFFSTGVFVGVISTLFVAILVSLVIGYSPLDDLSFDLTSKFKAPKTESLKFTFVPADKSEEVVPEKTAPVNGKEYTVQSGDSLESIAIKFYGSFDEAKLKGIQEANNMPNPDTIGIGQKLIIPMN